MTSNGVTLTADAGDDIVCVCQLRQSLSESLLVGVTDADITGSNWSAMIKCHLGASYSFLSDKAQYPKVLNRTHQVHVYFLDSCFQTRRQHLNKFQKVLKP